MVSQDNAAKLLQEMAILVSSVTLLNLKHFQPRPHCKTSSAQAVYNVLQINNLSKTSSNRIFCFKKRATQWYSLVLQCHLAAIFEAKFDKSPYWQKFEYILVNIRTNQQWCSELFENLEEQVISIDHLLQKPLQSWSKLAWPCLKLLMLDSLHILVTWGTTRAFMFSSTSFFGHLHTVHAPS